MEGEGPSEAPQKVAATPETPSGTVASVAFMLTAAMKASLRAIGFTDDQIHRLTPQEAHNILATQGLSRRDIDAHADWYQESAYSQMQEGGDVNAAALDEELRRRLAAQVLPEHIEIEFQRVMDAVFGAPGQDPPGM
jgi:hypothetical protein